MGASLIKPTIHLNGSDPVRLKELYWEAQHAIGEALRKMYDASPNARDYYPQGDGAYQKARAEDEERIRAVKRAQEDLMALYEHCDDAVHEREQRRKAKG